MILFELRTFVTLLLDELGPAECEGSGLEAVVGFDFLNVSLEHSGYLCRDRTFGLVYRGQLFLIPQLVAHFTGFDARILGDGTNLALVIHGHIAAPVTPRERITASLNRRGECLA